MEFSWATEPGSGSVPNEDFVLTTPDIVIVMDGVTRPRGQGTGCVHGTPWFVRRLGTETLRRLVDEPRTPLNGAAAEAVDSVAAMHRDTCDLVHPATPSTTLAILRAREDVVDYLALADSVIVLDQAAGIRVVTDPENVAVAASNAETVSEAIVGNVPRPGLRRAAALTDGASRLVDEFGLADWPDLLDILEKAGPDGLIRRVRDAERADSGGAWWPRAKVHDDATAAFWRFAAVARGEPE